MRQSFTGIVRTAKLFLATLPFLTASPSNALDKEASRITLSIAIDNLKLEAERTSRASPRATTGATKSVRESLSDALVDGNLEAVKETYREPKGTPPARRLTPLYIALFYDHKELVKYFLVNGESVNEPSYYNGTSDNKSRRKGYRKSLSSLDEIKKTVPPVLPSTSSTSLASRMKKLLRPKLASKTKAEKLPRVQPEHFHDQQEDHQNILGSAVIDGETPLFLIAKKDEPTETDYKLAQRLFKYGASLTVAAQLKNRIGPTTPLEILEEKVRNIAATQTFVPSPSKGPPERIRKKFKDAMENKESKVEMASIWYLFADGNETTHLIDSFNTGTLADRKNALLPFLNCLVPWELDVVLPEPSEAWDRYQRVKDLLSDKMRFNMLLKYFVLRKEEASHPATSPHRLSFEDVKALYSYVDVAKAINAVHLDQFLRIHPEHVAAKGILEKESRNLHRMLHAMTRLSTLIAFSIASSDDPAAQFVYWRRVAEKLFEMNNFFGTLCVYSGLNMQSVGFRIPDDKIDFGTLPNLQNQIAYRNAIRDIQNEPYIPSIIHEAVQIKVLAEAKSTFGGEIVGANENSLSAVLGDVLGAIKFTQKRLKKHPVPAAKEELVNYFSRIPLRETNEQAALLWSLLEGKAKEKLSAKNEEEPAEYWDTYRFAHWLGSMRFSAKNIRQLLDNGIVDGPTFLSKYALARNSQNSLSAYPEIDHLFLMYDGWLVSKKLKALSNLSRGHKFPGHLWSDPNSTFQWIMWLRNNKLAESALPKLLANNVDNFSALTKLQLAHGAQAFKDMGIEDHALEHLKHVAKRYNQRDEQPLDMSKWTIVHLEIWLYERGLAHFISVIKHDKTWKSHRMLSLLYFLKRFGAKARKPLGSRYYWVDRLSEELPADFAKTIEKSAAELVFSPGLSDKSYLFFTKALIRIGASESILAFYNDKIRNLNALARVLSQPFNELVHDDENVCSSTRSLDAKWSDESESQCDSTRSTDSRFSEDKDESCDSRRRTKVASISDIMCSGLSHEQHSKLLSYGLNSEQQNALRQLITMPQGNARSTPCTALTAISVEQKRP